MFCCPLCGEPLAVGANGASCVNKHNFDRAKEGYLNLLPVQKKNSKEPGDSREQLQSRQMFLEKGFYSSLKQKLFSIIPKDTKTVLDLGCGEGYFSRGMAQYFSESLHSVSLVAIDVAKEGVRLAAKAAKRKNLAGEYIVASNFDVPCADESFDLITRIFAPSSDEELQRLLRPSGTLIIVAPGAGHLIKLRQLIYRNVLAHEPPKVPQGFMQTGFTSVRGLITLNNSEDTRALLEMTPFSWRLRSEIRGQIIDGGLDDEFHFDFFIYQKIIEK